MLTHFKRGGEGRGTHGSGGDTTETRILNSTTSPVSNKKVQEGELTPPFDLSLRVPWLVICAANTTAAIFGKPPKPTPVELRSLQPRGRLLYII
jgi:hypothetical protein